jgi:hypothetical protein
MEVEINPRSDQSYRPDYAGSAMHVHRGGRLVGGRRRSPAPYNVFRYRNGQTVQLNPKLTESVNSIKRLTRDWNFFTFRAKPLGSS